MILNISFVIHLITNKNRNSEIFRTLEVTAFCSSAHETKVISGTYIAKGVFGSHIIYEKTVPDRHGNWWSLRYDTPSHDPTNKRWIFKYNHQQVAIENYLKKPG